MEQEMAEMTDNTTPTHGGERSLLERLAQGPVICAEGYLFELERRGYLQAGAFVPEVVLEHPEAVTRLHEDFVHAGSDVVERSEEHTSELQSLMRISYAVFCLKKKTEYTPNQ